MADNEIGLTITGDISDILAELGNLISELEGITDKIVDLIINVDDSQLINVDAETDGVTESLNEASNAAESLSYSMTDMATGETISFAAEATDDLNNSLENATDSARTLGEAINEIDTTQLDAAKESADNLSESLSGAGSGAESAVSSTGTGETGSGGDVDLAEGLGNIGAAAAGIGILDQLTDSAGEYGDSWARVASVMGTSAASVQSVWGGAVSEMAANTGRRASDIRNYLIQMGIAGVTSQQTLISMFPGISGAAFATGNSVESITQALRRVVSTGTLGARQLMSLGLSEQDVMNATGLTLDQVNEKLTTMDSNSRAAYMAQIINSKYAGEANENYKNSWQHVNDQLGAAWDYVMILFGQAILPIAIPALEIMTGLLKQLSAWFNGLNSDQKLLIGTILVLVLGFIGLAGTIGALILVFNLLSLSMLANPIFLVVFAVAALIAAFIYLYNTNEQFRASMDGVWAALTGFGDWLSGGFYAIVNGVGGAWTNFINSVKSGIEWLVSLPKRMYDWGVNAINNFVKGIAEAIPGLNEKLDAIRRLFPQSPPKEGPLSKITPEGMGSWMGSIAGAGMNAIAGFNLGNVGIPNVPTISNNSNSSSMQITVDMAGVNLASGLEAQTAGERVGSGLASKLVGQASNAGISVVNSRR